jgi:hypothetical protein
MGAMAFFRNRELENLEKGKEKPRTECYSKFNKDYNDYNRKRKSFTFSNDQNGLPIKSALRKRR